MVRKRLKRRGVAVGCAIALAGLAAGVGGTGASAAGTAHKAAVTTVNMIDLNGEQSTLGVVLPYFNKSYPNIKINVTYVPTPAALAQLETTQLAAGSGADIMLVLPGDGLPFSVWPLAAKGYLAPLNPKPKMPKGQQQPNLAQLALIQQRDGFKGKLYAYTPGVLTYGLWVNQTLFKKLGLSIPTTFPQLLNVCRKAKAAGVIPMALGGTNTQAVANLVTALAMATVDDKDPNFVQQRMKNKVTFSSYAGWTQALNNFQAMNAAGCFEFGAVGTAFPQATEDFSTGQALMDSEISDEYGQIETYHPSFQFEQVPWPAGSTPAMTGSETGLTPSFGVRANSTVKAAAETFLYWLAENPNDIGYAKTDGDIAQYDWTKGIVPSFISPALAALVKSGKLHGQEQFSWWNSAVSGALTTDVDGLLVGTENPSQVLADMDKAWVMGPDAPGAP